MKAVNTRCVRYVLRPSFDSERAGHGLQCSAPAYAGSLPYIP